MKRLIILFMMTVLVLVQAGCSAKQSIGALVSPAASDEKISSDVDLNEYKKERILVLVNQPAWLHSEHNLRAMLTRKILDELEEQAEVPAKALISYDAVARFRESGAVLSDNSPAGIAGALEADVVVLVEIEDYRVERLVEGEYYKGLMVTGSSVLETSDWQKLWPTSQEQSRDKVGFDVESGSRDKAAKRLIDAASHCIVRDLYDCRKVNYSHPDDISGMVWQKWE